MNALRLLSQSMLFIILRTYTYMYIPLQVYSVWFNITVFLIIFHHNCFFEITFYTVIVLWKFVNPLCTRNCYIPYTVLIRYCYTRIQVRLIPTSILPAFCLVGFFDKIEIKFQVYKHVNYECPKYYHSAHKACQCSCHKSRACYLRNQSGRHTFFQHI